MFGSCPSCLTLYWLPGSEGGKAIRSTQNGSGLPANRHWYSVAISRQCTWVLPFLKALDHLLEIAERLPNKELEDFFRRCCFEVLSERQAGFILEASYRDTLLL